MLFRNYEGKMVQAPNDLSNHLADYERGVVVMSSDSYRIQVRYCLQVKQFPLEQFKEAKAEFISCIEHSLGQI